ncbi:MAG: DUF4127 family protein [Vulcanimicrobiota bacterium]
MKVLYIPIDNRPCTMSFPAHLAQIAGLSLIMPPRELLGEYRSPGDPAMVLSWLGDMSRNVDTAIISIDMLVYGGLIASRSDIIHEREVSKNVQALEAWLVKREIPSVYAFSVIMRSMPTYTSPEVEKASSQFIKILNRLYEISEKTPHALPTHIEQAKKQMKGGISPSYFSIRQRNHRINQQAVKWRKEKLLDFLILGLDDVVTKGLNIYEKKILEGILARDSLTSVHIYPGTDEIAMILLARLVCERYGQFPSFSVLYSSNEGRKAVPLYEDRSVEDLVKTYLSVLKGKMSMSESDSDISLFVHLFPRGQREAGWQRVKKTGRAQISSFVSRIKKSVDADRLAAVADIAYANGADITLAEMITGSLKIPNLTAYAAWNTAGNTLGTVIAQAALRWIALTYHHRLEEPALAEKAQHSFTFSRFLDDWIYQSDLRDKVKSLCAREKISVFNLEESRSRIEHLIDSMLTSRGEELFRKAFAGNFLLPGISSKGAYISIQEPLTCQVSLPWPRIFEVDIFCDFTLQQRSLKTRTPLC